jgi:uncharacterized repeat protein (TIGR01451 family)
LGAVPAGSSATVTVSAMVDPAQPVGTLINRASVSSATPDPVADNDSATAGTDLTAAADLSLSKQFDGDAATPGGTVGWTLTVANAGPSVADAVVVTDPVPATVTVTSAAIVGGGACTDDGQQVSCPLGDVQPGVPQRISVTGTLAPDASGTLTNQATVGSGTSDPDTGDNTGSSAVPIAPTADLRIGKAITSGPPVAGDPVTFVITVSNDGPSDGTGVRVADTLPDTVLTASALVAGDGSCIVQGQRLDCELATVPAGTTRRITVTGTLAQSVGDLLTNTATVAADTTDPDPGNNSSTASDAVTGSADLSVSKTGPDSAVAGGPVSWTLAVHNAGPSDASGVQLADAAPDGVTGYAVSVDGGAECADPSGCALGTIPAGGAVRLTATGTLDPGHRAGTLLNTAAVTADTPDPDGGNNTARATTTVTDSADLSVTKTVTPDPLVPGRPAAYTVTVHNAGPSDAAAVIATDPLPDGMAVAAGGISADQGSCTMVGRTVSCALGVLTAGASTAIVIPVDLDAAVTSDVVRNAAAASSTTPDPDQVNNTGSVTTDVRPLADLTVIKQGPSRVAAGAPASWTVTVSNAGPSQAQQVVLTDAVPDGLHEVAATTSQGGCTVVDATVTCPLGTVGVGDAAAVSVAISGVLDPSFAGTELINRVQIDSPTPEPGDPADGRTASATAAVDRLADVSVTKVATADEVLAGGPVGWTITVRNDGPSTAADVVLTDALSGGLARASFAAPAGVSCTDDGVCTIGDLLPGAEHSVRIGVTGTVHAAYDQPDMVNEVAVAASTPDPDPGDNTATARVGVIRSADLVLTKTADRDTAIPGHTVTYRLTVHNDGPSDATDVVLTDPLPAGLADARASWEGGAGDADCAVDAGSVTCALDRLAAGADAVATVTATVAAATAPGELINAATVAAAGDPVADNDSASASVTVTPAPSTSPTPTSSAGTATTSPTPPTPSTSSIGSGTSAPTGTSASTTSGTTVPSATGTGAPGSTLAPTSGGTSSTGAGSAGGGTGGTPPPGSMPDTGVAAGPHTAWGLAMLLGGALLLLLAGRRNRETPRHR